MENNNVNREIHPEDLTAEEVGVGAALFFNDEDFNKQADDGGKILIVSKPLKHLETWITSANEMDPEINNLSQFIRYLANYQE